MCPPRLSPQWLYGNSRTLGHGMCVYTLFELHCGVTRVLKLRAVSDA